MEGWWFERNRRGGIAANVAPIMTAHQSRSIMRKYYTEPSRWMMPWRKASITACERSSTPIFESKWLT